jgi:acetyl-CoA carboxylase biotin carboxylase subunit
VIKSLLVANRGEIACRIIRTARRLGVRTVAVYSDADAHARHVREADEALWIGPPPARDSYLDAARILAAARAAAVEAIHPGYGFLAENAAFARACEDAGVVFIGPKSESITLMGEKTSARRVAVDAGVPVVPGTLEPLGDDAAIEQEAGRIGFPLMLKAAAGGGGKGLRLVTRRPELASAVLRARSEAQSAFGDDSVYIEKAIVRPRHIEIQVLADHHGHAVHLFERECSIQRRHQKVIEESPSPFVTPELRERMGTLAVALVKKTGYRNAGTLEFLVDQDRNPYFLEMNTRLQVEHPVTELVTGVDLVKLQIRIAEGDPLPFEQKDLSQRGHAIECRVYAEDPDQNFLPSPGRIVALRVPGGPGVRDDSGVVEGATVPIHYDPLISKLAVHAATRADAIARMRRAVSEYKVLGIRTTLPFFERVLRHPDFISGDLDTSFLETAFPAHADKREPPTDAAIVLAAIRGFLERHSATRGEQPANDGGAWRRAGLREAQASRL